MMLLSLEIAVKAAVIGYVYAAILIQPGEILHWLFRIFQKLLTTKEIITIDPPEELIGKVPATKREIIKEHWLLKPLGGCEKCTAGQISFWLFLYASIFQKYYLYNDSIFVITNHVFTICLTILITILIKRLFQKLNRP